MKKVIMITHKLSAQRRSPQFIIALFGLVFMAVSIFLITNEYAKKSEKVIYANMFDRLKAINEIKKHKLEIYFSYRKADIQALATTQTILNLTQELSALDREFGVKGGTLEAYKALLSGFKSYDIYLKNYLKEYMYEDIMLIDVQEGHVMYAVRDQGYIGIDLNASLYKTSELARVYKRVLHDGRTHLSDMHKPILHGDDPVMLLATPVMIGNRIDAVLVLKLPSNIINSVMHFQSSSKKSLESYAVGEDKRLRSDSLLEPKLTVKNVFNQQDTTLIETQAVRDVFAGKSAKGLIKDYRNIDVLSVYSGFVIDTFTWAIITEIDEAEVVKEFEAIRYEIYTVSLVISLIVAILGYFGVQSIIRNYIIQPMEELYTIAKGFEEVIDQSSNEIFIYDKKSLYFSYANRAALANIGYTRTELLDMKPYQIKPLFSKEDLNRLLYLLTSHQQKSVKFQTVCQRKNGSRYNAAVNLQLIDIDGEEKFVAFVDDITDEQRALEEREYYYELSSHDHLTKIYNRQMFDELFARKVEDALRYKFDLYMILFDIDNFKRINDTYGHAKGDVVLQKIALEVSKNVRKSDLFARWGGEEFVIILSYSSYEAAMQKAEEIRSKVAAIDFETIGTVTCSFGVSTLKEGDAHILFSHADEALYRAKKGGKNRVEFV